MDRAGRTGGRGNAGKTAGSFFHPSGPSEFGHLIQRKSLICRAKLARGAGRAPFHPVNPGSSKKSMSAHQLHRMMDISYEAAWFMFHRLREAAVDTDPSRLGGENLVVEADETYIGGKARNKAFGPPPKKEAVLTVVQRDGEARSKHVAKVTAKALRETIVTKVSRKSYLMTDEALIYTRLGREFSGHGTVNHSANEYVRTGGFHHTNTVESFFALFKRAIYGQFHHVSEAHLHRYLAEADFKYNHRTALGIDDAERTDALLRGAKGKRLYYRQPNETPNN